MIFLFLILIFSGIEGNAKDLVDAKIVTEYSTLQKGKNTIGVLFKIEPQWHIYWKNPGDSGLPTEFEWELPDNVSISDPYFPAPKKIPFSDMANYGYENEVLILFDLDVMEDTFDKITLKANVNWLVCKEKCLSGSKKIKTDFSIAHKDEKSKYFDLFQTFRDRLPVKKDIQIIAIKNDNKILITGKSESIPDIVEFFPYDSGIYVHGADQNYTKNNSKYSLTLTMDNFRVEEPENIYGILKITNDKETNFFEINVPINNKE